MEAKVTMTMTPKELDLIRASIVNHRDIQAAFLKNRGQDARANQAARATIVQCEDLLAKLT
jgi:hypothetical protein